jgi:hypothetical protein
MPNGVAFPSVGGSSLTDPALTLAVRPGPHPARRQVAMTSCERLADARFRTAQALAGAAPGLSQDHFECPCLVLAFTASRAGLVVTVPEPVAAAARAAEVDLLSVAGSAADRPRRTAARELPPGADPPGADQRRVQPRPWPRRVNHQDLVMTAHPPGGEARSRKARTATRVRPAILEDPSPR